MPRSVLSRDLHLIITPERHQASITIEGVKFVVDCGFVKVVCVV